MRLFEETGRHGHDRCIKIAGIQVHIKQLHMPKAIYRGKVTPNVFHVHTAIAWPSASRSTKTPMVLASHIPGQLAA